MGETTQRAHNTAQSIEATGEHHRSPSAAEKHHFAKRRNKGVNTNQINTYAIR
jgi:hypothetical protein